LDDEFAGWNEVREIRVLSFEVRFSFLHDETFQGGFTIDQGGDNVFIPRLAEFQNNGISGTNMSVDHGLAAHSQSEGPRITRDAKGGDVDGDTAFFFLGDGFCHTSGDATVDWDIDYLLPLEFFREDNGTGFSCETDNDAFALKRTQVAHGSSLTGKAKVRLNLARRGHDPVFVVSLFEKIEEFALSFSQSVSLMFPVTLCSLRSLALSALAFLTACSPAAPPKVAVAPPPAEAASDAVLIKPRARPERPALPVTAEPKVFAESALIIDAVTGRVLFQKNADTRRAVASTQKLLTALVVARSGPLDDPVEIVKSDTLVEPSKLYLKAGEVYTRGYLLQALLVKSGNDVAKALARDVAGSETEFVALMNRTAMSLGMRNSHFKNPHGLTEKGQFSTARDIAILSREVMQIPFLRDCMKIKQYTFEYPSGRTREVENTNKVLSRLPYCTGMKTGTTRASGKCLVSSGTLNGRSAIAVALGSKDPDVWSDSEKMLRYALE